MKCFATKKQSRTTCLTVPILEWDAPLRYIERRSQAQRPEVFCCWCDMTAYGLVRSARARGYRVPEDLAVTGFDGFLDRKGGELCLTTISVPWITIATTACQALVQQITDNTPLPQELVLEGELIRGNTTSSKVI